MIHEGKYISMAEPIQLVDKTQVPGLKRTIDQINVDQEQESEEDQPNKKVAVEKCVLLVKGLTQVMTPQDISGLFDSYDGFIDVRIVPGKHDIAFVEFESLEFAGLVIQEMHGRNIDGMSLQVIVAEQ